MKKYLPFLFLMLLGCAYDDVKPSKGSGALKRLSTVKVLENSDSSVNTFLPLYEQKYIYQDGLLAKVEWYDYVRIDSDSLSLSTIDSFTYDAQQRLVESRRQMYASETYTFFWVTQFEYGDDKTTIRIFELFGDKKSPYPDDIRYRIKTERGFKYMDDSKTVEYVFDDKGNVVSQIFNGNECKNFNYDNSPNPFYQPDNYQGFTDGKVLSKNNLIESCFNSFDLKYDAQGYLSSQTVGYSNTSDKFRYEFTYR